MIRIEDLNTDINIDSEMSKDILAEIKTSTITKAEITDSYTANKIETSTLEKQIQRCLNIDEFIKMIHREY